MYDFEIDNNLYLHHDLQYIICLEICRQFPNAMRSIANSCAMLLNTQHKFDFVRTGKAMYALLNSNEIDITTTFSFIAKILQVIDVYPGSTIGYNQTFEANQKMNIATTSAGFADGIPFQFSYSNIASKAKLYKHKCAIHINCTK